MIVKGKCRVCSEEKDVIDTISICCDCIRQMRKSPTISEETKAALKWIVNAQYGEMKTAGEPLCFECLKPMGEERGTTKIDGVTVNIHFKCYEKMQ